MIVLGLVFGCVGAVLAFNAARSADRLAAISRTFPGWIKPIGADYALTGRFVGAVFLVVGLGLVIVGVVNRT